MNLKIVFEGPFDVGQDKEEWVATMPALPGMVTTGDSQEEAFEEMMISLRIKAAYDSDYRLPELG